MFCSTFGWNFRAPSTGLALLMVLGLSGTLMTQVSLAQDVPYSGVVVEDSAQLRAGAGASYYVVGQLAKGTEVRVEEIAYGWSKIAPPTGSFSFISKTYIDPAPDAKSGKVNASSEKAPVKAASPNGPGDSFRTQVNLKPGDSVTILGDEGNFYKIAPPAGAYVYAAPGSIQRKSMTEAPVAPKPAPTLTPAPAAPKPAPAAAPAPAPAAPKPAATVTFAPSSTTPGSVTTEPPTTIEKQPKPATPAALPAKPSTDVAIVEPTKSSEATPSDAGTPATAVMGPTTKPAHAPAARAAVNNDGGLIPANIEPSTAVAAPAVGVGGLPAAQSPQVQAAEERYGSVMKDPLEKQPLGELVKTYETLNSDATLPVLDRRIVAARLAQLKRNRDLANAISGISKAQSGVSQIKYEPLTNRVPNNGPETNYNAVGQLLASSVYNGSNLPTLFRIVDPANGRTVAYVRPVTPLTPLEWAAMLGRTVGVNGESKYDPAMKLQIIDVTKVDLLSAKEPAKEGGSKAAPASEK